MAERKDDKSKGRFLRVAVMFVGVREMTGGARSIANMIAGLRDQGMDALLVTDAESELSATVRVGGAAVEFAPLPERLRVRDHGVLKYGLLGKLAAARDALVYGFRLAARLRRMEVDCLVARNCKTVLLVGLGCRWQGIRLVWDVCLESTLTGLMRRLQVVGYWLADVVVSEARCQWETLFGGPRRKLHYVTPGIADERYAQLVAVRARRDGRRSAGRVRILGLSSITPRKNQMLLLEGLVASGVAERFEVWLVGAVHDEAYADRLRQFVAKSGLAVHFMGWREDVVELLAEADLLALVSTDEGVPNAIREAMIAGVPVVATPVGGVPDIVRDQETGILISRENAVTSLSEILRQIAEGTVDLHRLARNAADEASQFQISEWMSRYAAILRGLKA